MEPRQKQGVVEPREFDFIIVAYSGGKDCTAALLHLLEIGAPKERIELWHHEVDGREGSSLMDWPVTPAYCRAVAGALGLPLYSSWREGGFEREMLRKDSPTAPVHWENPDGTIGNSGGEGPRGTRLKFPQVSANLSVRWCSASLKIDVASASIRNQERFIGKRVLLVSGERAQESPGRARYNEFERDRTHTNRRVVMRWRPVHQWGEKEVWDIIRRHGVIPHPAYYLGWSRLSCRACIFGRADQWASLRNIDPGGFQTIANYEQQFGVTIHRRETLESLSEQGCIPQPGLDAKKAAEAMSLKWRGPALISPEDWLLPYGAFRGGAGPS